MKSSNAVFTRQDPFPADQMGKTYYRPSRIQQLSKKKRKTILSPVRVNQVPVGSPSQIHSLGQEDPCFLGKANHLDTCYRPNANGQPSFSESWPSTDLGTSPPNTRPSSNIEAPKESGPAKKSSSDQGDQQDSVLAKYKYVERFRRGRPQSREERQQAASTVGGEREPFWWMSPSSLPPSSTPTQTTDEDLTLILRDHTNTLSSVMRSRRGRTPSPPGEFLDLSALGLSDTSQGDLGDPEILQLQERANRLLRKSEHSGSSDSIPISSEGLGCLDFSPISADEPCRQMPLDEPVRRPTIPSLMESATGAANVSLASHPVDPSSRTPSAAAASVARKRPEEDILFQWRVRRKMEQAWQWPHSLPQQCSSLNPALIGHNPGFHQSSLTGQTPKTVAPSLGFAPQQDAQESHERPLPPTVPPAPSPHFPVSSPAVSRLQTTETPVPAHTHLLCDVLPCPARLCPARPSRAPPERQRRSASQRSDGSRTKEASQKPQQAAGDSTDTSTEEPASKDEWSPPPPPPLAWSGPAEEGRVVHHRRAQRKEESEEKEKRTGISSRKQKKSSRHHHAGRDRAERPNYPGRSSSCHKESPEKVPPWTERCGRDGGQQERCQVLPREGRPGDCAPPPSPIHSALGQVVSEVLFPTLDSPPTHRTPVSSDSPRYTPPAPPQSPVPLAEVRQPMEVISQLLQEAEDSDERDFEDDPLLKVLRRQRQRVKEQIREVDSMLDELREE